MCSFRYHVSLSLCSTPCNIMVKSCSVFECTESTYEGRMSQKKSNKVSFHRVPLKATVRRLWLQKIRRRDYFYSNTQHIFVCSKHFLNVDFCDQEKPGVVRLKKEAIPSIFNWNFDKNINALKPNKMSVDLQRNDAGSQQNEDHSEANETCYVSNEYHSQPIEACSASNEDFSPLNKVCSEPKEDSLPQNKDHLLAKHLRTDLLITNSDIMDVGVRRESLEKSSNPTFTTNNNNSKCQYQLQEEVLKLTEALKAKEAEVNKLSANLKEVNAELTTTQTNLQDANFKILTLNLNLKKKEGQIYRNLEEIKSFKQRNLGLQKQVGHLSKNTLTLDKIKDNDVDVLFYTGIPSYAKLMALYEFIAPGENGENIRYWRKRIPEVNLVALTFCPSNKNF